MRHLMGKCLWLGLALATPAVFAQSAAAAKEPSRAIVSLYRVAPGKHVAFLKWMADRDAIDKQLGLPRAQWYAHFQGDSWDYVAVAPVLTDAQQKKEDDAAKAKGLTTGPKSSIEFREFIASHTDTLTFGPMTVSEMATAINNP
ncbi:hypothetical protein ACXU4B_01455 [Dyella soli]|uniref:Uncharacterized protein n=1 Tax=Dyella soli TaxID=522319 RepID=A0A4R0YLL5_9GAMM|nr:hypothetical protein [Dyella soli]TCI09737.1 hypothetical protein EZM97_12320 [Dyella soli]